MRPVHTARNPAEAQAIQAALAREGIDAWIEPSQLFGAGGALFPDHTGAWDIFVVQDDDRGPALAAIRRFLDERRAETPRDRWRCGACGEILEPQYLACWRCGAGRDEAASEPPPAGEEPGEEASDESGEEAGGETLEDSRQETAGGAAAGAGAETGETPAGTEGPAPATPAAAAPRAPLSRATFWRRAALLFLFLVPLVVAAPIVGTAAHEFLGHGLFALAMGGRFEGVTLHWHGEGSALADLPPGASPGRKALFYASGTIAQTVLGALALWWALRPSRKIAARVTFLMVAANSLTWPASAFWSLRRGVRSDDLGTILSLLGLGPTWQGPYLFLAAGVALHIWIQALIFRSVEEWTGGGRRLSGRRRGVAVALFVVFPGAGYVLATSSEAAATPVVMFHLGLAAATGAVLHLRSLAPRLSPAPLASLAWPTCTSWLLGGGLVAACVLELGHGVSWSRTVLGMPSVAPGGTRILFAVVEPGPGFVVLDLESGRTRLLEPPEGRSVVSACWDPAPERLWVTAISQAPRVESRGSSSRGSRS